MPSFEEVEQLCAAENGVEAAWAIIQEGLRNEFIPGESDGRVPWREHNGEAWRNHNTAGLQVNENYHRRGLYIWADGENPQYIGITNQNGGFQGRFRKYVGREGATNPVLSIAIDYSEQFQNLNPVNTLNLTKRELVERYAQLELAQQFMDPFYTSRLEQAERYARCGAENICFFIIPSLGDNITEERLKRVEGILVQYVNQHVLPPGLPLLNREHAQ